MCIRDSYQTVLTDDGVNISKGQKQLLTIARAMLSNARMLILDEATSNVDSRTEIDVYKRQVLANEAKNGIEWLKTIDANLSQVGSFGGASVKRIHKPVNDEGKTVAVGSYLVPKLTKAAEDKGVQFVMETAATELVVTDGKVTGVKAGDTTYTGKAVILALSLIHIYIEFPLLMMDMTELPSALFRAQRQNITASGIPGQAKPQLAVIHLMMDRLDA